MAHAIPPTPRPLRVAFFIDGQNLYHRCKDHFGYPWMHPRLLANALISEDHAQAGVNSRVLTCIRFYTGIHQLAKRPAEHGSMTRRLAAYKAHDIQTIPIPVRYDNKGKAREKGVDVRIGLDLVRFAYKGLFDVAVLVSEDSDLDQAVKDVYALRDHERWIAVENAAPWKAGRKKTHWLVSAPRKRRITQAIFDVARDDTVY